MQNQDFPFCPALKTDVEGVVQCRKKIRMGKGPVPGTAGSAYDDEDSDEAEFVVVPSSGSASGSGSDSESVAGSATGSAAGSASGSASGCTLPAGNWKMFVALCEASQGKPLDRVVDALHMSVRESLKALTMSPKVEAASEALTRSRRKVTKAVNKLKGLKNQTTMAAMASEASACNKHVALVMDSAQLLLGEKFGSGRPAAAAGVEDLGGLTRSHAKARDTHRREVNAVFDWMMAYVEHEPGSGPFRSARLHSKFRATVKSMTPSQSKKK